MKKIPFSFFFLFLISELKISSAQTYHPFPDTLSQWSEGTVYCYVVGVRSCEGQGYIYSLFGDTMINGQAYNLIGYNLAYSWGDYDPEINYPYQFPGEVFGAIREDSSRKVWFRNFDSQLNWVGCFLFTYSYPLTVDSDLLLYDFGLNVGDTAYWAAYEYNKVVRKTDSIQILDGSWRRVIAFDTLIDAFTADYWIEGIGSAWGLFGPYCREPFEGECNLNCYKNTDTLLLESPAFYLLTDCNHIYTNAEDIKTSGVVSVFPNPVSDYLTLESGSYPGKKFSISIYNSAGQPLKNFSSFHSSELKIPVDEIGCDGMYFYMIRTDDQKFFSGKFLIQR